MQLIANKRCPRCEQTKPASAFRSVRTRPNGLSAYCRECLKAQDQKRYAENRDERLAYMRGYYQRNAEQARQKAADYRSRLRAGALRAYAVDKPECACCGEHHVEFLEIDHINNNGAAHRREIGSTIQVLRWLRDNGYPNGFQILCRNCNLAKWAYGQCPHERGL